MTHQETIKCPSCEKLQDATVEHTAPFWTYIHFCEHCEYMIMESEWETVKRVYIEVKAFKGGEVIHRIEVTGKSERTIDRIDTGLNLNLNHELYYTTVNEYDYKQDEL